MVAAKVPAAVLLDRLNQVAQGVMDDALTGGRGHYYVSAGRRQIRARFNASLVRSSRSSRSHR